VSFVHEVHERQQYVPEGSGCEGGCRKGDSNTSPRAQDVKGDAATPIGGGNMKVRMVKKGLDKGILVQSTTSGVSMTL